MYECECCSDCFDYEDELEEHMDDVGHWPECETCPKLFRTWRACNQHMDDTGHRAPEFECETCTRVFGSSHAADQHMKALGHYKNYCKACDRFFQNENNLKMHLNSKLHRGSNIKCPFCRIGYTTASGLSHHLETGSCSQAPGLTRGMIHHLVSERDRNGAFTKKLIGWHEENTQYSATNAAFNGSFWECYICHREFRKIGSLNAHLNSPVHKSKLYHCPNRNCGKEFLSLAGLFQHLESESCSFMRFGKVQQKAIEVFSGGKLITLQ